MSAQVCQNCTAAYSIGAPKCPECGANNPRPLGDDQAAPAVKVRCGNQDCDANSTVRQVPLRLAAAGVVERPPLHCAVCGLELKTVTDEDEEDDEMPKVTVHGGPSIEGVAEDEVEMADGRRVRLPADTDSTDDEGGEEPSPTPEGPGTSSSTSSTKQPSTPETSENETPSPARKTASRSGKARTGSSTAHGTDGDQTAPTSKTDADES